MNIPSFEESAVKLFHILSKNGNGWCLHQSGLAIRLPLCPNFFQVFIYQEIRYHTLWAITTFSLYVILLQIKSLLWEGYSCIQQRVMRYSSATNHFWKDLGAKLCGRQQDPCSHEATQIGQVQQLRSPGVSSSWEALLPLRRVGLRQPKEKCWSPRYVCPCLEVYLIFTARRGQW